MLLTRDISNNQSNIGQYSTHITTYSIYQPLKFVLYHQWKQLPASADTLFAQGEQDSLFLSRVWFETLTSQALTKDQSLHLVCVLEDERVLAIAPMMQHTQGNLSSLNNNFTTLFSILVSNDDQLDAILNCLAQGLSQMSVASIRFEPIDKDNHVMNKLCQLMESYGFTSHPYFRFYNWSHQLNGQSSNEYMAQRPTSLCNTIKRKQNKLEREHDCIIRMYKDIDIDEALADYQTVYQASWKANEFFSGFTPALVKRLSKLNWLRMAILYADQQAVAAQIWFVVHGKANIYRLVYDENWKHYSPGSILTQYLMRYVIDTDKVSEIDFLTGNERYKQDWMMLRKERIGIRFVKQTKPGSWYKRIFKRIKSK